MNAFHSPISVPFPQDAKKPHVMISERMEKSADTYNVVSVPFPYTSREAYEGAMRMPLVSVAEAAGGGNGAGRFVPLVLVCVVLLRGADALYFPTVLLVADGFPGGVVLASLPAQSRRAARPTRTLRSGT